MERDIFPSVDNGIKQHVMQFISVKTKADDEQGILPE